MTRNDSGSDEPASGALHAKTKRIKKLPKKGAGREEKKVWVLFRITEHVPTSTRTLIGNSTLGAGGKTERGNCFARLIKSARGS